MRFVFAFGLAVILGFLPHYVLADGLPPHSQNERITSYVDQVIIKPDSTLAVTEGIDVIAAGQQIKHGIYRDFPIHYKNRDGSQVTVGFHVIGAWRDGQSVSYMVQPMGENERVYLGSTNEFVSPGPHAYILQYTTDRQIGYFENYDELYWNVTGNNWVFPIDQVSATITLPPGGKVIQQSAYTGYAGEQGKDFTQSTDASGNIVFMTTRPLGPHEGLTIAVAWPKGLVHQPDKWELIVDFLKDNLIFLAVIILYLVMAGTMLRLWWLRGRSAKKGIVIPFFAPPDNIPPCLANTIYMKKADNTLMGIPASLVDMAVKKYIKIAEADASTFLGIHMGKPTYTIQKLQPTSEGLPEGEKELFDGFFSSGDELTFNLSNTELIQAVGRDYDKRQDDIVEGTYYADNRKYAGGSLAFSVAAFIMLFRHTSPYQTSIIFLFFITNFIFHRVMSGTLTPLGRQVYDKIEGFKMYLSVAEKSRLEMFTPPKMTPEIFEKYLPYAMALGVANQWGQQFATAMASAEFAQYQPTWYVGSDWQMGSIAGFANGLSDNLSGALIASSSPPGSVSGSDGGGSSGGGGGGGGGGGF